MDGQLIHMVLVVFSVISTRQLASTQNTEVKEVCNMESFNATCGLDEVVLMEDARFGRMQIGRCVKKDLGYLGCAANVFSVLDQKCSGKQQCILSVPDPTLHDTEPCPPDTTPYLEATYKCVTVSQMDRMPPRCTENTPLMLRDPSGYISSSLTRLWSVGTQRCPWKIQVARGQRIRLTKYNFESTSVTDQLSGTGGGVDTDSFSPHRPDTCFEYANLREDSKLVKRVSLCRGESRESHFYTTTSNELEVSLVSPQILGSLGAFLLKYEAIGCPDLAPVVSGKITRKGDNVTITCDDGNEIWYQTCKGTKWQGQRGNCTKGGKSTSPFDPPADFPFGILLVVAIGVALGVFLGGLLLILAVIYMKRKHRGQYAHDDFHQHHDTLGPRGHFPEHHKTAMMINIHSEDSPHWDHISKSVDSDDTTIRDPSCRSCALPCSQQQLIPLGAPPPGERIGHLTGPRDMQYGTDGVKRSHVYECPKFNS